MSYGSSMSGSFRIDPPLRWAQYRDSGHYPLDRAKETGRGVYLTEVVKNVDTDDGPMERRTAEQVVFAWDYPVKLYDIVKELQALVDAYPDHTFSGTLWGEGTDWGDIWKIVVTDDRKVVRVLPKITWPDGTVHLNTRYQ